MAIGGDVRMKVAFVSQPWDDVVPPVQLGSIQLITYELARRLAARSYDVAILARQGAGQVREQTYEGVQYRRVPIRPVDRTVGPVTMLEYAVNFPWPTRPYFSSRLYFSGYF